MEEHETKHLIEKSRRFISALIKPKKIRTDVDLDNLIPLIQKIQFFREREIKQENFKLIVESLTYEMAKKGDYVFRQGE